MPHADGLEVRLSWRLVYDLTLTQSCAWPGIPDCSFAQADAFYLKIWCFKHTACRMWVDRLLAHEQAYRSIVGGPIYRTWVLYLAPSALSFEAGLPDIHQVLLAKTSAAGKEIEPRRETLDTGIPLLLKRAGQVRASPWVLAVTSCYAAAACAGPSVRPSVSTVASGSCLPSRCGRLLDAFLYPYPILFYARLRCGAPRFVVGVLWRTSPDVMSPYG